MRVSNITIRNLETSNNIMNAHCHPIEGSNADTFSQIPNTQYIHTHARAHARTCAGKKNWKRKLEGHSGGAQIMCLVAESSFISRGQILVLTSRASITFSRETWFRIHLEAYVKPGKPGRISLKLLIGHHQILYSNRTYAKKLHAVGFEPMTLKMAKL